MSLRTLLRPILLACLALLAAPLAIAAPAATTIVQLPQPPDFEARGYMLMDANSGQVLAERNSDLRIEPASITKLMTAYIVFAELKAGHLHLNDDITISEKAWRTGGSRMFVQVGTKVRTEDLIRGMIIQSGNDATVALAESIAGTEETFAELMTQYAQRLGMKNSHFRNATGLPDPDHYSTAADIATLGRALVRDFPEDYKYYSEREYTYNNITQQNRNMLLGREPGVDGMKTGFTDAARYCMVASALRNDMRLIAVVVGTPSPKARAADAAALLNYGFRFYETHRLYDVEHPVDKIRLWKGQAQELAIGVRQPLYVTTPRGHRQNLSIKAKVQNMVMAPLAAGQQLGSITVTLAGTVIREEPLVALQAAPLGSWWRRLVDEIRLMIHR